MTDHDMPPLEIESTEAPSISIHRFARDAMATTFEVFIANEDATYSEQAALEVFDEIHRLEEELSRFVPASDIAQINALEEGERRTLGIDAFRCVEMAKSLHMSTRGAFDVAAGSGVSVDALLLDNENMTAEVTASGLRIDLGGIGKGYALDRAAELLRDWSLERSLIHCGQSTVLALEPPEGRDGWRVSIRDPRCHSKTLGDAILTNQALSGSGVLLHGAHIIDPRTGNAVAMRLGSWSVAPVAAVSDALSTALMVMSAEEAGSYFASHSDEAGLLMSNDGDLVRWGELFLPVGVLTRS